MAGRGPVPKETRARERATEPLTEVASTGELYGQPLPEGILPKGESWHPQTLALWEAFREWPVMANLPAVSWQFLIDTMLQHHVMWTLGKWEFASEVRLRMAKYFVTPDDQMRAKLKIQTPGQSEPAAVKQPAGVTSIASRRARLTEGA